MKVQNIIDGQIGTAVQMAGSFMWQGKRQPARTWVVCLPPRRFLMGPDHFRAQFNIVDTRAGDERVAPA